MIFLIDCTEFDLLDSDQEPSYDLLKNLLLLPRILKLIVDMVDDSIPLLWEKTRMEKIYGTRLEPLRGEADILLNKMCQDLMKHLKKKKICFRTIHFKQT